MCFISQTDLLLEQAELYVQSAIQHLLPPNPETAEPEKTRAIEDQAARLRIHFLFPQLPTCQSRWLLVLYWQRKALTRLINTSQRGFPPLLRSQMESATRQIERCFMAVVAQVKDPAFTATMSPTQLAVLEREFLRIPFLEAPPCRPVPVNATPPQEDLD